jgi:hypothetical protein
MIPPQTSGVYLACFADDTCMYATVQREGFALRKLQRGLNSIEMWCQRWKIKIKADKDRPIYFSHRDRPPEAHLTLNGRNIPFVNHVKYLGVIVDKRITWRLHIEITETKAFSTFITVHSLLKLSD